MVSEIPFRDFAVETTDAGLMLYPLSKREMEAVKEVASSGEECVVRTPRGFTVVAKDSLGIKISRYTLRIVLRIPNVEYVLGKYGDILRLVASMQPVRLRDLDVAFTREKPELARRPWQHEFLTECRLFGIIAVENDDALLSNWLISLTDFGKKLVEGADAPCH